MAIIPRPATRFPDFLKDGGEMGALMRAHDWPATTLGGSETWPASLRAAVRLLLNTGHPMYIFWDGEHGPCIYNDAYRHSIGPERHPVSLGQPARVVWEEIWDIIGPQIEQVMAGRGATWNQDHLVPITRNGRREDVYWTYSYSPIDDETAASGVGGVLVICTETTGKVVAEQRLAAQAARQRRLFEAAPSFVAILRAPEHVFEFVNAEYVRLFGGREFVGKSVREVFPDIDGQGFYELLDKVYATGERHVATHVPVRLQLSPGEVMEERFLDYIYQPITDEAGKVSGIFVEGHDVTEAHLAQAALRELNETLEARVVERTAQLQANEARLRTIFETSYQMQGLLAPDGTVLDANATSLSLVGATLGDVIGKPYWDTPWFKGTPATRDLVRAAVSAAGRGESVRQEVSISDPSGVRTYDFSVRAIHDEGGAVIAIVPEALDITDRRRAEEALRQSQKLEAMGQLTGGVAHDFNNLLTPIIGSLDMLNRRRVGNEREQRMIDGALQSAERAKTLVQRLLAFARRQPLQPEAVDVGKLIGGMADLVASASAPRVRLALDVATDLPPAKADPNQLEMAILNLSVNARDAMSDGGVLTISATAEIVGAGHRSHVPAGRYVRLSVADTGTGMDEVTMSRAIEPFFSTKGIGKGTGLGLSMVHGLASQLGGALTILSKPGLGTRIDLWLPASEASAPIVHSKASAAPCSTVCGTALLVDDEDLVRASTADMLAELGYEVIEAASGEAALALLAGDVHVDILISDHLMPGMTGTDLARSVRAIRPDLRIVITSGYAEVEGIALDLPRLTKPFRSADLFAVLSGLDEGSELETGVQP